MRSSGGRLTALIVGSSLGAAGWGAVLPFLYADVATARGFGPGAAAVTFTAFALGALLAAPFAGRLADRARPVVVATWARIGLAGSIVALALAGSATTVWLAAAAYGAALAVTQPAVQVMMLAWTPEHRRRDAFAWQFIAQNLALAAGGFVGGQVIDLSTPIGSRPVYAIALAASLLSALAVWVVGRGVRATPMTVREADCLEPVGYRAVLRQAPVRWLLVVTALLILACYAQFDSGLPAYALSVLDVSPSVLGSAVALNAVLVAALTAPVVALTRGVTPTRLLTVCALVFAGCWLVLGVPLTSASHPHAAALVVTGFALFSVGETMLAPVLTPLAATLAPEGAAGRTLAAVNGAQTLATAVGPGLSGVLLALGAPVGLIVLQLACCAVAVLGARRLGRTLTRREHALAA